MGWSESQFSVCRSHPFEIPQPGICPCCLRERLSFLAAGNNHYAVSSNFSQPLRNLHALYSSNSSSGSSPRRSRRRHQRVASDVMGSISTAFGSLHKSRSVANHVKREDRSDDYCLKRKKKAGGFWNKLRVFNRGWGRWWVLTVGSGDQEWITAVGNC